jgi:hypothetical protein
MKGGELGEGPLEKEFVEMVKKIAESSFATWQFSSLAIMNLRKMGSKLCVG